MGEITKWIVGILLCSIFIVAFSGFYMGGITPSAMPAPFPTNETTPDLVLFSGTADLINGTTKMSEAINRLAQPQGNIVTDAAAFADIGGSLIKIVVSFPKMIGGFVYDISNAFFTVLPDDPSGTLVTVLGLVVVIVVVTLIFAIAAMIRSPGIGTY
jgi:hypothetical protein